MLGGARRSKNQFTKRTIVREDRSVGVARGTSEEKKRLGNCRKVTVRRPESSSAQKKERPPGTESKIGSRSYQRGEDKSTDQMQEG